MKETMRCPKNLELEKIQLEDEVDRITSELLQARAELERIQKQAAEMRDALKKAHVELNTIRARDGVPWTHMHMRSDVAETYFSSVVDDCKAALADEAGKGYLSPAEVREAVKPLVEALKRFAACNPTGLVSIPRNKIFLWKPSQTSRDLPGISLADIDHANVALEHAKTKGLM